MVKRSARKTAKGCKSGKGRKSAAMPGASAPVVNIYEEEDWSFGSENSSDGVPDEKKAVNTDKKEAGNTDKKEAGNTDKKADNPTILDCSVVLQRIKPGAGTLPEKKDENSSRKRKRDAYSRRSAVSEDAVDDNNDLAEELSESESDDELFDGITQDMLTHAGYPRFVDFLMSKKLHDILNVSPVWAPSVSGVYPKDQVRYFERQGWTRFPDIKGFPIFYNDNVIVLAGTYVTLLTKSLYEYSRLDRKELVEDKREKEKEQTKADIIAKDRLKSLERKSCPPSQVLNEEPVNIKNPASTKKVVPKSDDESSFKLPKRVAEEEKLMNALTVPNPNLSSSQVIEICQHTHADSRLTNEAFRAIAEEGKEKKIVVFLHAYFQKYTYQGHAYHEPEYDHDLPCHVGVIVIYKKQFQLFDCNHNENALKEDSDLGYFHVRAKHVAFQYLKERLGYSPPRNKPKAVTPRELLPRATKRAKTSETKENVAPKPAPQVLPVTVMKSESTLPIQNKKVTFVPGITITRPPGWVHNSCSLSAIFFADQLYRGNKIVDFNYSQTIAFLYTDAFCFYNGVHLPRKKLNKLAWSADTRYPFQEVLDRLMSNKTNRLFDQRKVSMREAVQRDLKNYGARENNAFDDKKLLRRIKTCRKKEGWMR